MIQPHANMRLCMADVIGHAWMQGPTASAEEVRAEFARRHEINVARAMEENQQIGNDNAGARARRGEQINDNVYLSGNLSQVDKEDPNVVCLKMKPYDPQITKNTSFFTNYVPEQVLKALTDTLTKKGIKFKISDKTWKLTYSLTRKEVKEEDEEEEEESKEES